MQTADGLFAVNRQMRITAWNEAATRLLGYESEDVIGKTCYEVLCQPRSSGRDSCHRNCRVLSNAKRGRSTEDFDLTSTRSDGVKRKLNVTVLFEQPLARDGEVVHLFRDVTDRRAVEGVVNDHFGDDASQPNTSPNLLPRVLADGSFPFTLSRREEQVLRLLAVGKATGDIASTLQIKPVTARNHIARLMNKLGASTRLQSVAIGTKLGLI